MDDKELIVNTAKEILLAHVQRGQGQVGIVGDDFKLLVSKVKEAVDSLEETNSFANQNIEASHR